MRDLPTFAGYDEKMDVGLCAQRCQKWKKKYLGLQEGSSCWCGNSFGAHGESADSCQTRCLGNDDEMCGGKLFNSVYELQDDQLHIHSDNESVAKAELPLATPFSKRRGKKLERYSSQLGLDEHEVVLKVCPCFLVSELLVQGCLIVTERHVCFHSNMFGKRRRKKIKFEDILKISKEKVYALFPTGIGVTTATEKVTFSSATSRDRLVQLLRQQQLLAARRVSAIETNEENEAARERAISRRKLGRSSRRKQQSEAPRKPVDPETHGRQNSWQSLLLACLVGTLIVLIVTGLLISMPLGKMEHQVMLTNSQLEKDSDRKAATDQSDETQQPLGAELRDIIQALGELQGKLLLLKPMLARACQ
uniref:WSC domain-containing protein n=1 Tax=Macrostomum lignano TaxID=282301 RepID=A0A1I8J9R8_9PLAT